MIIVNGRCLGDEAGEYSFISNRGCSVIDLVIVSPLIWKDILSLTVDQCLDSDHNPLILRLVCGNERSVSVEKRQKINRLFWDESRKDELRLAMEEICTTNKFDLMEDLSDCLFSLALFQYNFANIFISAIQREEEKAKRSLKDAAKKNNKDVCVILAKEILRSRKAVSRLYASKAQINSVMMNMNQQLATIRLSGSLQKSTDVMKSMQNLIKLPEIAKTMQDLSKEMLRAGIIDEMLEDTLEGMDDQELEDEAQEEVDKVLWELTAGQLGEAPAAVTESLPAEKEAEAESAVDAEDTDVTEMQERLEALRN
ncbi:charged multivesicular body protein 3-like [Centruroides sculpturatus]|uniref:charged multivesicular body protein 3-like n=1 Tax=Centruroides sculpturatus TaxID=218467 RepID=UPI000C6E19A8|nr:charged multivesicular body protein 3-like [Centruroides sculpturatus]